MRASLSLFQIQMCFVVVDSLRRLSSSIDLTLTVILSGHIRQLLVSRAHTPETFDQPMLSNITKRLVC